MGARLTKFEFCPKPNEEIEAIITIKKERRAAIHGIVLDWQNKPVKDAVVKLFEKDKKDFGSGLKPITHTFTDECGEFLFGPLDHRKCYVIKVWFSDPVFSREVVVNATDSPDCNEPKDSCDTNEDCFISNINPYEDDEI